MRGVVIVALLAAGCTQSDLDAPIEMNELDRDYFDCNVAPVLIASCGTLACHGSAERPFVVYGRARHRMERPMPWTVAAWEAELTDAETQANYESAHAFALDREQPLLTEKPLEAGRGGLYHGADGLLGPMDVFADRGDPGYQTLRAWIDGATLTGACPDPEPEPEPQPDPDPPGDGGGDGDPPRGDQ